MDISNAIPEQSDITVKGTDDFSDIKNSDIIIISASTGTYTTSRTEMLNEQVEMIKDISKKVLNYCPTAKILMISNPLDVLTYIFQKETNLERKRVIGIASSLDSSRFRYLLSTKLGVSQSRILGAQVIGEHGDSMVPVFSQVKIDGKNLNELINNQEKEAITEEIRNYWKALRNYKTRSQFGIAKNTYDVVKTILQGETLEIPASVVVQGEYGETGVSMGIPVKISNDGISEIKEILLDDNEKILLKKSADVIRNYIKSI